jgi:hypothetical protein
MGLGVESRSDELLRAERLSKSYGHIPILHDVSFVVPPRSIVGWSERTAPVRRRCSTS